MGGTWRIALLCLLALQGTAAFLAPGIPGAGAAARGSRWARSAPSHSAARQVPVCLAPGSKVGKAKVDLRTSTKEIAAPKQDGASQKTRQKTKKTTRVNEEEDMPMFRVNLLGDEAYPREHVIMSIQDIIPETDSVRAAEVFEEAQASGKGLCGIFDEEQSELYVEQFSRCEPMIFSEMEKE